MKRVLLVLILLSLSSNVFAEEEWEYLTKGRSGEASIYINNESIIKKDEYAYVWTLIDYIKPNKWGSLSSKTYMQFNCKWYRYKSLYHSYHKEPMAKDHVMISSRRGAEWKSLFTQDKRAIIFDRVCS